MSFPVRFSLRFLERPKSFRAGQVFRKYLGPLVPWSLGLRRSLARLVLLSIVSSPLFGQVDRITGRSFATRSEVIAQNGMVCTSQPLATQIGLDVLKAGGSAVDAAIAANAALGLMEPTSNGIGGDLFAIVYDAKSKKLRGLNASGRSPRGLSLDQLKTELTRLGKPLPDPIPLKIQFPISGPECVDSVYAQSVPSKETMTGMARIPGGTFTMGSYVTSNTLDRSDGKEMSDAPAHAVTLSAFYLAKTETTYADWVEVRTWARDAARGAGAYDIEASVGGGKGDTHPVQTVSWYDVVKWCNAKSEREGLTPVYYTNDAQTAAYVYRTGDVNVTAGQVKWGANGYRLPTEAEREYAARGGVSGQRFPWGDTITHAQANYPSFASYAYDVSPTRGNHPTYGTGSSPYTSPVGVFAANGYGLSDMVGNVWEWCWDWYGISYGSGAVSDPRGAASGSFRVSRGGSWNRGAGGARSAGRNDGHPGNRGNGIGFRPARSSVP